MKDTGSHLAWTRGERRQNQLLSAEPLSPTLGDKAVSFTYDGQGRRVTKMVEAWNGSAWIFLEKMRFTWDGWNLVEEEITTGGSYSLAKQYTWGIDLSGTMHRAGGVGGLVFIKDLSSASSADYAYHFDANGNVLQLTDNAKNTVASYRYDAFGKVREATGSYASANPFQFSTKYFDPETQLNYYGYRYYSSNLGRWINRDPIGELSFVVNTQESHWGDNKIGTVFHEEWTYSNQYQYLLYLIIAQDALYQNLCRFLQNDLLNETDYLGLRGSSRSKCLKRGEAFEWLPKNPDEEPSTNGCTGVPDSYGAADFTDACNNHDKCYGTCSEDQESCDSQFYDDLISACENANWKSSGRVSSSRKKAKCKIRARTYYNGVQTRGSRFYNNAQNQYCECKCPEDSEE